MRTSLLSLRQPLVLRKALRGALFFPASCFVAVLLIASGAFAQAGSQANNTGQSSADAPAAEKSVISGKVVYEGNGRPVRRANVMLLSASDTQASEKYSTATDHLGKFRIRNVPAGTYFVMVDAPGILSPIAFIDMDEDRGLKLADWSEVRKNFEEVSVDGTNEVKVEVRARRGAAISGKVTYPDGDPAINVQLSILRKRGNSTARFITGMTPLGMMGVRTDDRGMYRANGLPPGEYFVSAAEMHTDTQEEETNYAPGHGMDRFMRDLFMSDALTATYYGDVTSARDARVVKLEADEEASDINISLIERQTYSITGRLTAKRDHRPLSSAEIKIRSTETIGPLLPAERITRTDAEGNWRFKDVPEGSYIITAEPPYEPSPTDDETDEKPARAVRRKLSRKQQQVTVEGSDIAALELELTEGASISGTVTFEGGRKNPNEAMVLVERVDGIKTPEPEYAGLDQDGKFTLEGLAAGELFLNVKFYGGEGYIKSITAGGTDLLREPLKLIQSQDIKDVRIIASNDLATLDGHVLDAPNGQPRKDVLVSLIPNIPQRWRVQSGRLNGRTNKAGEFQLRGAPGEYLIFFWPLDQMPEKVEEGYIKAHAATAQRVTLQPGGRQSVEFVMPVGQN